MGFIMNKKQYGYLTFLFIQSAFCGLSATATTKPNATETAVVNGFTTIAPSIHSCEQVAILSSLLGGGYIVKGVYTIACEPKKQDGSSLTKDEKQQLIRSGKRYIKVGSALCIPLACFALAKTVNL